MHRPLRTDRWRESGERGTHTGIDPDTDNTTSKINVGAVGGGVVGAAVVFLGIVVGLIFFCRRKKKRQQRRNEPDGTELPMLSDLERNGGTADDDIIPRKFGPKADENKNNDRRVRGLTILNDELFVAYFTSNIIEALPIPSCTQYRKVVVNGLKDPGTMAACATNSCLYVIDKIASSNKKIFKFKPDGEVIREWNTDDDDYGRISVSDDGNVIMTDYRKHKLKIYSSDGDLLPERTIDFTKFSGTKIDYLFHAIDVTDGRFVISHGSYQSDVHRVCKIDAKGNLLLSFGNEIGSDEAQLNFPAYLAKRQNGSILVADQNNDRIILLSSDLTFKTVLFTKEKDDVILPDVMQIYEKTEPPLLFLGCNETVMSGGYVVVLSLE